MATGLPLNVPAWYTGPDGAMADIISFLPPNTAIGKPPPTILPKHVKSGMTL